jgi:hypothetical protein
MLTAFWCREMFLVVFFFKLLSTLIDMEVWWSGCGNLRRVFYSMQETEPQAPQTQRMQQV